jgi:hypothetical protein
MAINRVVEFIFGYSLSNSVFYNMETAYALKDLITESKDRAIWEAIAANRLKEATTMITDRLPQPKKQALGFLKKPAVNQEDAILQIALDIISSIPVDKKLSQLKLYINKQGETLFAELVRLLFALHENGQFATQVITVADKTLPVLRDLAEQVKLEAGDYPNNTIAGYVWISGAAIRSWCNALALLFQRIDDLRGRADALQYKFMISWSIMNHYPYTVCPDMIAAGRALEEAGEPNHAKKYYETLIARFQWIADEVKENPEEEVWEEQIISLQSLNQAYESLDRLNNTTHFTEQLQFVQRIIERGATYNPDEEEEDEDEQQGATNKQ